MITEEPAFRLGTAVAIGLLIGAERERRKAADPEFASPGIRTFAICGLLGGTSVLLGGYILLAVATLATAAVCAVAYLRSDEKDRGTTTEVALLLTVILGGLAQQAPGMASGAAVIVAILLAARTPLHHFVGVVLSKDEATDALIFATATFVILPLTPNRYLGPLHAINPRAVWVVVVLMISISAIGYILVRLLGARAGLPLAGFASGFVSSAATIGSMGERAKREPAIARSAVAGAVASNVATIVEMAIVVAAVSRPVFLRSDRRLLLGALPPSPMQRYSPL